MNKDYNKIYISEIIRLLRDTAGRNDKIAILADALATNSEFLAVAKYTYNPYMNYYIGSLKSIEDVVPFRKLKAGFRNMSKCFNILDALNRKGSADHADKKKFAYALEELAAHDIEIFDLILKGSFDCGISASSINKALPGTIPVFKVMLCEKFNQKSIKNIEYPAFAQVKMDGLRVLAFVEGNKVSIRTRSGKDIEAHGKLDNVLIKFAKGGSCVLDGELLVMKKDGSGYENRATGNGIGNKAIRGSITPEDADRFVFVAWDLISATTFWARAGSIPYWVRLQTLTDGFNGLKSDKLKIVEGIECNDYFEVQKYYEKQLSKGQEGIILKNSNAGYEGKRSKHNIKFKIENTADLVIEEVIEGAGKYTGRLGSFRCTTSDGIISVNVGSGFSDSQREEYFTNSMVGQVIEVKYNEIITDKFGDKSLFLPIFICVRHDKVEANSFNELK